MNQTGLNKYLKECIIPQYASFDSAHREDHAITVMDQSMKLLDQMSEWLTSQTEPDSQWMVPVDRNMLLTAAACHDIGLVNGRERHHIDSGDMIRRDTMLRQWFTADQIETIAQAAEDHRASGKTPPRSIYGMLVAEADRVIDGETIIRRTIQFGFKNYPSMDREEHIRRAISHLREKYGKGGYLKLWIPWSDNAVRLASLQEIIADEEAIRKETERIYDSLVMTSEA